MKFPVFDLHCDTALELLGRKDKQQISIAKNSLHIDLERAKSLSGYAQCFACFTTPDMTKWMGVSPEAVFKAEQAAIMNAIQKHSDVFCQAFNADDIEKNRRNGTISAILTIEGPSGFGFDSAKLEELYEIGFRITTLGWNESNVLTGSHVTGEGLTEKGREYIRQAQRLGMIIDVSHISDTAFWQIMDMTAAPVIASHSNSRRICNVSRNLTDEMFVALCKTGGLTGINLYTEFLGENPDIGTVCDHILHFLELDPAGEHIALGGDLDGCDTLPTGFSGVQDYNKLSDALLSRGVPEHIILNIFWNNAMGVMKKCCM